MLAATALEQEMAAVVVVSSPEVDAPVLDMIQFRCRQRRQDTVNVGETAAHVFDFIEKFVIIDLLELSTFYGVFDVLCSQRNGRLEVFKTFSFHFQNQSDGGM